MENSVLERVVGTKEQLKVRKNQPRLKALFTSHSALQSNVAKVININNKTKSKVKLNKTYLCLTR
jgi:translation initiation factor 2 gamma subunit (eIF-2gamma)